MYCNNIYLAVHIYGIVVGMSQKIDVGVFWTYYSTAFLLQSVLLLGKLLV